MDVHFGVDVVWTGNRGTGTDTYRSYSRAHSVSAPGLPEILASSEKRFHGDSDRYNPELLLVAAVSECHMLTYLHLAVQAGIVVEAYTDSAEGALVLHADGSGEITNVTLHPRVTVASADQIGIAEGLHARVPALCFIARSVNFPIRHEPTTVSGPTPATT